MRLFKLAGLSTVALGIIWLGSEGYIRVKEGSKWMRYGESMALINEGKFLDEREDVLAGLNSDLCDYIERFGYGINMPRNENQEEHFKRFGIKFVSIKTKNGDKLSDLSYLFYKNSSEWYNSKFFNNEFTHYAPNEQLPEGLELKIHMLPDQLSQYKRDFPEREVEICPSN